MITLKNEQLEKILKRYTNLWLDVENLMVDTSMIESKYNNKMKLLSVQYDLADNFLTNIKQEIHSFQIVG